MKTSGRAVIQAFQLSPFVISIPECSISSYLFEINVSPVIDVI